MIKDKTDNLTPTIKSDKKDDASSQQKSDTSSLSENVCYQHWSPKVKKIHFTQKRLMLITSILLFVGGVICALDGYFSIYYINNPNVYSFFLAYQQGFSVTPLYTYLPLTVEVDYTDIPKFKSLYWKNETMEEQLIYYYVQNSKPLGDSALRLFINYIIFGCCQIIASIFAFNIREPHYKWKKDIIPLILFESIANIATVANLTIWLLIEFGDAVAFFIFLSGHSIVHYISIVLIVSNLGIKVFLFLLAYSDYFAAVIKKKPPEKVSLDEKNE